MKLNALLKTAGFFALASIPAFAGTPSPAPTPIAEEETDLGITATIGYDTDFVFRGVDFADHWISAAIGFEVPLVDTVSLVAGATYGASADDSAAGLGLSYQRLELNGGLSFDLGAADLGLGYRYYNHQGQLSQILDEGHEVGLTLATEAGPLNIGLGGYYDFGIEGWYFEAAVNSEIRITDSISLVPGASIGYGLDYSWHIVGFQQDGFTAVNLSLALPIKLTRAATLTPYVAANLPIDALESAGEDSIIYGGVRLSVSF